MKKDIERLIWQAQAQDVGRNWRYDPGMMLKA
jgi:hypothetical protein